jgi:hypothetical protein
MKFLDFSEPIHKIWLLDPIFHLDLITIIMLRNVYTSEATHYICSPAFHFLSFLGIYILISTLFSNTLSGRSEGWDHILYTYKTAG